jgi:glutamine amidotransferase
MNVAILKYNAGNVRSVQIALERIGIDALLTDDHASLLSADKIIFPGVGEASSAMAYLRDKNLDKLLLSCKQPVLGICLGMQLMCAYSEENNTNCLGIFKESVRRFKPTAANEKIPQMGWNNIADLNSSLFEGIQSGAYCYFVHGYYADKGEHTVAVTSYCGEYSSALQRNQYYGVQFHPEKSAEVGMKILENFLKSVEDCLLLQYNE